MHFAQFVSRQGSLYACLCEVVNGVARHHCQHAVYVLVTHHSENNAQGGVLLVGELPGYVLYTAYIVSGITYCAWCIVEKVKAYFAWNVINTAAGYLSDDFVKESFKFYGTALSGKEEMRPRWKRVTGTVDGALGEAVGQMYVEKYFPKEAKDRMIILFRYLCS